MCMKIHKNPWWKNVFIYAKPKHIQLSMADIYSCTMSEVPMKVLVWYNIFTLTKKKKD